MVQITIERKTCDMLRSFTKSNHFTGGYEEREDGRVDIDLDDETFGQLLPHALKCGSFDEAIRELMKQNGEHDANR